MILNYESNVNESDDDELLLCYRNVEKSNKEAKKKKNEERLGKEREMVFVLR